MTTRGSRPAVADARFFMTSRAARAPARPRSRPGDDRRRPPRRPVTSASAIHRRAVRRHDVGRQLADGEDVAGDLEHPLLDGVVERLAALENGANDRLPEVVLVARRRGRRGPRGPSKSRSVRRGSTDDPVRHILQAPAPGRRGSLGSAGIRAAGAGTLGYERDPQNVAMVKPLGGLRHHVARAGGNPFDEQGVGSDTDLSTRTGGVGQRCASHNRTTAPADRGCSGDRGPGSRSHQQGAGQQTP